MSGDLPVIRFFRKTPCFFWKMVSISGDLPVVRFLEKLHAFSKKWSQCRVTCPFWYFLEKLHAFSERKVSMSGDLPVVRFLEKLHAFLKNGLNVGWPARFESQKKSSYLKEWSSAGSQFSFAVLLTWDSVSQRFPKTWNHFGFRHTFPARLMFMTV